MQLEYTCPESTLFEVKSLSSEGFFEGYASTYHIDKHGDMIRPGAFRHTLKHWRQAGKWPLLLWQHDMKTPLGAFTYMEENNHGLLVRGLLELEVQAAREAYVLLKKRIISGLSIGFENVLSRFNPQKRVREIFQVKLREVSIVTLPANPMAGVACIKAAA